MRGFILVSMLSALVGCGSEDVTDGRGGGQPGQPGDDPFQNAQGGGSDTIPGGHDGVGNMAPAAPATPLPGAGSDATCGGDVYAAEAKPVDIYVIMDESLSMILPVDNWAPVTMALNQFFSSPDTAGIGVGIQFFSGECNAGTYASPVVPIAELPGNAMALSDAMAARVAAVGTATTPALQGAIQHAKDRSAMFPERKTVVLLVTDGEPITCGSTVATTAAAAAEGLANDPPISTYVLGLGNVGGLDQMAAAGGTDKAFVVSDPGSVQGVVDAMNQIRTNALPCEYKVPESSGGFDKNLVNLDWTKEDGSLTTVPYVTEQANCDAVQGGWYYDDQTAPSELVACDSTCDAFKQGGSVNVVLGCPQVVLE